MKHIITALIAACLLFSATSSETAAGLKAGDVDPKTGKIIKYWAAPMDPTYIRNEPGKSPMGMDLIPVYEQKDGEKLPASTIKIDPVTVQNMGVRTAAVQRMELKKSIRALGTVTYDETRIYAVNLKFDSWSPPRRSICLPVRRRKVSPTAAIQVCGKIPPGCLKQPGSVCGTGILKTHRSGSWRKKVRYKKI
jgi:hypothetical protein